MNNMCEEKKLGKALCDACVEKNWLLIFFTKKVRAKLETYVLNRFANSKQLLVQSDLY